MTVVSTKDENVFFIVSFLCSVGHKKYKQIPLYKFVWQNDCEKVSPVFDNGHRGVSFEGFISIHVLDIEQF